MIKINEAVIVEGKYDKIRLSNFVDGLIICTDGFRLFKDSEKKQFIKRLAAERGILILTDSDAAGFKIRSYIKSFVPEEQIKNAYIPDIFGKEKRKDSPSAEGKLGVEGISDDILRAAIERAGITMLDSKAHNSEITMADLYRLGLTGTQNSAERRRKVFTSLGLPARLSSSAFLRVANMFITMDDIENAVATLDE